MTIFMLPSQSINNDPFKLSEDFNNDKTFEISKTTLLFIESDFETVENTKTLNNQDKIIKNPNPTHNLFSSSDSYSTNKIYNFTSFLFYQNQSCLKNAMKQTI